MFGKINLALGISSKPQSNQQLSNKNNNNTQQKPNNQITQPYSKPLLSNPIFHQKLSKNSGKQFTAQKETSNDLNKTKPINKQSFTHPNQNNNKNIKNNKLNNNNKPQVSSFQAQMQGSKFRILNELLYTSSSQQAMKHFEQNPEDYLTYHQGYRSQSQKWQSKPVNVLIKYFRKCFKQYKDKVICDLGCGQGFLYQGLTKEKYQKQDNQGNTNQVKNKHCFKSDNILSYDLVALKPFIQVADIKNLPLENSSVDVVVFCLSLMGKNYLQFITQAHRVLKQSNGQLIMAEVESRSKNWRAFGEMIEMVGFELVNNGVSLGSGEEKQQKGEEDKGGKKVEERQDKQQGRYFRILQFRKSNKGDERVRKIRHQDKNYTKENIGELSQLLLTECIYKKR